MDIGFAEIDKWHTDRGWSGCGYHFIIRRDGEIETGRDLGVVGAHAYGYNRVSVGICLVGGMDGAGNVANNFTSPQYVALATLLDDLATEYPDAEVLGHRDLSEDQDGDGIIEEWEWVKACPAFDVKEKLPMLRSLQKS